jgi:hypothetical protein
MFATTLWAFTHGIIQLAMARAAIWPGSESLSRI